MSRVASLWLGVLLAVLPVAAHASEARYALLVGAHRGNADEPRLYFAGRDAERLREVLVTLGDFPQENVTVLTDPNADRVRTALARMNARIREEVAHDRSSVLLVFYSGHADAESLHLGGTLLPWEELRNLTSGSSAAARLLVVDACRSGQATRVKGTKLAAPFALPPDVESHGLPEGFAILSSSAAGESAQESDSLQGSFFTHHLVAALRGVADTSADGLVSLAEAYQYAADRTVASTVATVGGVQHPTYLYELKGRSELVLTRPGRNQGLAAVRLEGAGQYYFRQGGRDGPVVLEAGISQEARTARLVPGAYFVQHRLPDRLREARVVAEEGQPLELAKASWSVVELDQLVRKGGGGGRTWTVGLWSRGTASLVEGFPFFPSGAVQASLDTSALTLDTELEGAHSGYTDDVSMKRRLSFGALRVGARKVFDVGPFSLSGGARLGAAYVDQRFPEQDSGRQAPRRWQVVPQLDTLLRADLHLPWWGFFVGAEAGVRTSWLRIQSSTGPEEVRTPVKGMFAGGLGLRW
ncbi:caspase family protein [Pyxidicoccus parkwayensis]|uniref:Caspase family protein n=1 Tax=Pyxidicoccus parkwayensis TaxID=2813578 RepID=A0ABX7NZZ7_9BACT|nr:caspase family protein [Pyxidicoccus parkwaysis]QSQ22999.1 caspase family protein [Pyxidicoccus parkwaysis]